MATEDNAFAELIQDYIVECLPLAEQVADAFIHLENRWRSGDPSGEGLDSVKACLHTVKGNSAMMGLTSLQEVAHALEDVCSLVATEPPTRRDDTAELLVGGSGLLCDLIRAAATASSGAPAADFVRRVRAFLAERQPATPPAADLVDERQGERRGSGRAVAGAGNVVRVDFRRLDAMLEILGEGLIQGSAIEDSYRRVARKTKPTDDLIDLDRTILALQKTLKRLEGALMEIRLLPVSTVVGRFPRLVRDLARSERKPVRLIVSGGETRLDKAILDQLSQPLIHLLTNAVVHGIEAPEERARAGKPAESTLELRATSSSTRVLIEVSDDGGGLDEAKIRAKAAALGVGARAASPEQLQSLIFLPGLTTAEQVSSLAGRGIGLDVVATSIHALGGTIEVENRPGRGVTFALGLPLTLAVVRSLIVEVDRERYAVPLDHVAETVRADQGEMHRINQQNVALWRGDAIQVSDAGELLGSSPFNQSPRRFCIVLSSGAKRRGILVDRLVGHQDIVVKSLDPNVGRPDLVSGTTILGDGRVACILDPLRLLEHRVPA